MSGEGVCVDINGASDSFEPGEEATAAPSPPANPSTTLDDSEDTITTLPEEEQQKDGEEEGDSAKSFVISPEPSPEKLVGDVGEAGSESEDLGTPSEVSEIPSSGTTPGQSPDGGNATVVNSPNSNGSKCVCESSFKRQNIETTMELNWSFLLELFLLCTSQAVVMN